MGVAKQFYHKLRAVRDALGLKYRFEMILDDGSKHLALSEHFTKRVSKWRGSSYHGDLPPGRVMSYRELENLPCLVVLAGRSRAGLGFPRSVRGLVGGWSGWLDTSCLATRPRVGSFSG